ncbi:MAG: hypothetical protein VKO65_04715 [Cyanobacteriota bacterium]|nr:hypothetical protein [Cyanobacteriota bacterium]
MAGERAGRADGDRGDRDPGRSGILEHQKGRAAAGEGDDFALLHQTYGPQPLPLHVHLLTTGVEVAVKKRLRQAYARGGISHRRLFDAHDQNHSERWAAELAEAIDACLEQIDAG